MRTNNESAGGLGAGKVRLISSPQSYREPLVERGFDHRQTFSGIYAYCGFWLAINPRYGFRCFLQGGNVNDVAMSEEPFVTGAAIPAACPLLMHFFVPVQEVGLKPTLEGSNHSWKLFSEWILFR